MIASPNARLTKPQRTILLGLIRDRPGDTAREIAAAFRRLAGRPLSVVSVCRARKVGYVRDGAP